MSAFPQASPKESSLKLVSLSSRAILHSWPVVTVLQRNTSNNKNGSHWRSHSSTFWVAEDLAARSVGFGRGCHGGRTTSYKISWDCSMLALCYNCVPRLYIVASSNTSLLRRRYHAVQAPRPRWCAPPRLPFPSGPPRQQQMSLCRDQSPGTVPHLI